MNAHPNVERRDTGPAWMDKTATTEDMRIAERAEIWRANEEAAAQPVIDAIRALSQRSFSKHSAIVIVRALSCRIAASTWAKDETGETAVGVLDDLSDDLEVLS